MTRHVEIDYETRSDVDLRTCGAHVYFESPHARVLIGSYSLDGGPIRRWQYPDPCPPDLAQAIADGATISAHNAGFEACCFDWLHANLDWPLPAITQFRCTAATASAMALPRPLEGLGAALGLEVQKDKEGKRLINKFSKPRKPRKDEDPNGTYWNEPEDHPEDFELFKAYCDQDVLTEAAGDKRLVPLSDSEQAFWTLTETINRRGIRIDHRSARAAIRLAEKSKKQLDREMKLATGGYVTACSQVTKLVEWVQSQGVELSSAAKAEITDLLEADDVPDRVRTALELRQEAGKTSVSKLNAMLRRMNSDGRVRGSFIYHKASTGRTQSAGVNFNNLPRPRKVYEDADIDTGALFNAFRTEEPALLEMLYPEEPEPDDEEVLRYLHPNREGALGRPLHLISDAIRGFIWAAPDHDLIQADYSGIEGAVIAWMSGEDWKVDALHALIEDPSLPDMYRRTAADIMNTTTDVITKKHPLRQSVGKVSELALGFGGGVMAFVSMAQNYRVRLDALYGPVWKAADAERRERAARRYEGQLKRNQGGTDVLSREAWIACEIIKLGWRSTNPAIAQSWRDLEAAVREAVMYPGRVTGAARVKYVVKKGFLWALLPSGRCLAYGAPRLKDQVWARVKLADGTWSDAEVMDRDVAEREERKGLVQIEGATSAKVTVLGVDKTGNKLHRHALYGGLVAENNTQAVARDILVHGMWQAENAGYPIVLTVYDEIVAEVPRGFGDLGAFERLICEKPKWAAGLPLTAGGWRGKRYRKD